MIGPPVTYIIIIIITIIIIIIINIIIIIIIICHLHLWLLISAVSSSATRHYLGSGTDAAVVV